MREPRHARAEHRREHERSGEHAHAFRQRAHHEEQRRGKMLRLRAEALVQQLVRRQHLALKVRRDEQPADHEARRDVAGDDLEICEAAAELGPRIHRIGERRHADQRQRARLGGDDRQADDHPRRLPRSDEVVPDRAMRFSEPAAEPGDADKVGRQNGIVDGGKAHLTRARRRRGGAGLRVKSCETKDGAPSGPCDRTAQTCTEHERQRSVA